MLCGQVVGQPHTIDVVLTNNGAASISVRSFAFEVHDPDTTRLQAVASNPCTASGGFGTGCNPNFDDGDVGSGWDCAPPAPDEDTGEDGPGTAVSMLQCSAINVSASRRWPPGHLCDSRLFGTQHPPVRNWYNRVVVRRCPDQGPAFAEIASCDPVITVAMTCGGATLTINDFTLALDCDKATAGLQSACIIPSGPLRDVDVVLTNNTAAPRELNGFSFEVHDPDDAPQPTADRLRSAVSLRESRSRPGSARRGLLLRAAARQRHRRGRSRYGRVVPVMHKRVADRPDDPAGREHRAGLRALRRPDDRGEWDGRAVGSRML